MDKGQEILDGIFIGKKLAEFEHKMEKKNFWHEIFHKKRKSLSDSMENNFSV